MRAVLVSDALLASDAACVYIRLALETQFCRVVSVCSPTCSDASVAFVWLDAATAGVVVVRLKLAVVTELRLAATMRLDGVPEQTVDAVFV